MYVTLIELERLFFFIFTVIGFRLKIRMRLNIPARRVTWEYRGGGDGVNDLLTALFACYRNITFDPFRYRFRVAPRVYFSRHLIRLSRLFSSAIHRSPNAVLSRPANGEKVYNTFAFVYIKKNRVYNFSPSECIFAFSTLSNVPLFCQTTVLPSSDAAARGSEAFKMIPTEIEASLLFLRTSLGSGTSSVRVLAGS